MNDHRYDDIISLPHHQSPTRKKMTMTDRAAQFSPFAALSGYDAAIEEEARLTDTQTIPGDGALAELNEKMLLLAARAEERPTVTVTWFQPDPRKAGGQYMTVTDRVRKIRVWERELLLTDGTVIPLDAISALEGDAFAPPDLPD